MLGGSRRFPPFFKIPQETRKFFRAGLVAVIPAVAVILETTVAGLSLRAAAAVASCANYSQDHCGHTALNSATAFLILSLAGSVATQP